MPAQAVRSVVMCHHYVEARSIEEIRARHRSEEADEEFEGSPDTDDFDEPTESEEPPAEPRAPADD